MKNQTSPLAPRRQRDYAGVLSSILAILAGLLVGLIVLLATNPSNAFPAFSALITGGFYSGMKTFGNVLYYAVPIIMTGLGVGFGFKASIFNIGGAGQFIVGAFCGVYTASVWNLPGALGWIVPLLASMIGGALWALLPRPAARLSPREYRHCDDHDELHRHVSCELSHQDRPDL